METIIHFYTLVKTQQFNPETGLYLESSPYVYDIFKAEQENGKLTQLEVKPKQAPYAASLFNLYSTGLRYPSVLSDIFSDILSEIALTDNDGFAEIISKMA
jgi:hypothetical protein